jgi:DNA-binding MarR family transcriptional regulator
MFEETAYREKIAARMPDLMRSLLRCFSLSQLHICNSYDLTTSEAHLLLTLDPGENLSLGSVGERMELSKGRASRLVQSLREKGYLTNEEDPEDRRHSLIELTEKGRSIQAEITRDQVARCDVVLQEVPGETLPFIIPSLEALGEALEKIKHRILNETV